MLTLDPDEQTWLDDYRKVFALREQHPDAVRRMVVYGSKARGDAREDSDLDILLLVADEAEDLQRRLRRTTLMQVRLPPRRGHADRALDHGVHGRKVGDTEEPRLPIPTRR